MLFSLPLYGSFKTVFLFQDAFAFSLQVKSSEFITVYPNSNSTPRFRILPLLVLIEEMPEEAGNITLAILSSVILLYAATEKFSLLLKKPISIPTSIVFVFSHFKPGLAILDIRKPMVPL